MTIAPHLLAGSAAAAAITTNLPVAFLIGFFLHFIFDAIPHFDPGTVFKISDDENKPWPLWIYIFVMVEFVVIWAIVILLFKNRPDFAIIMAGGLGGIAVDVLDNNPFRFMRTWPIIKQIHFVHEKLHYDLDRRYWYVGLLTQFIVIGGSLWYLLKF